VPANVPAAEVSLLSSNYLLTNNGRCVRGFHSVVLRINTLLHSIHDAVFPIVTFPLYLHRGRIGPVGCLLLLVEAHPRFQVECACVHNLDVWDCHLSLRHLSLCPLSYRVCSSMATVTDDIWHRD
jgi:hypothetical protein